MEGEETVNTVMELTKLVKLKIKDNHHGRKDKGICRLRCTTCHTSGYKILFLLKSVSLKMTTKH